ncbi:MAG: aminotransferase class III-fold pyridoxal phosphate-dependent enzyme [Phycisphaerales bacterium]|nr:aminotransferase class III-fold pyridoxal phosphate-dependent enzyme [Phycisphaerales bacterium]
MTTRDTKYATLDELASEIARRQWQLDGVLTRLPGENYNARISTPDGRYVLKITTDGSTDVTLEQSVLHRLAQHGLPVPQTLPTITGEHLHRFLHDGIECTARILDHLPGCNWRDVESTPDLLLDIGRILADVHIALTGFTPPGARRTHQWDVAKAQQHRSRIEVFRDDRTSNALEYIMQLHAAVVLPGIAEAPEGIIHGDANDENILVENDAVVGLVDLGDCMQGALVQDLGITLAYAMQESGADLQTLATIVGAYHARRKLEDAEFELLFPLALSRLAASALIGADRMDVDPDHATWHSHTKTTIDAMHRFAHIEPATAELAFREACGRTKADRGPDRDSLLRRRTRHMGGNLSLAHGTPLHMIRGRGQYLHASDGRPYLDLVNNVCHVGHCHPHVVDAISRQAGRLNTNTRYLHDTILTYCERITATMPDPLSVCYFVNSGSEANELALRLARAATGAHDALVIDGAYHGSTPNCVAMSPYKFNGKGGSGQRDWVHVLDMPDIYRGAYRDEDAGSAYGLDVADAIGTACRNGRAIAAFFAESMLSCGGQIPLPDDYLACAAEHVRNAGGLYIADEVQVGFGRMGDAFWGFQLHDVVPDIVVLGKPIGNGHPIGAVVTTPEIAEAFDNGMEFFSTFGGNPVSCECAMAVLDVVENEGLQDRARTLGTRMIDGLRALQTAHPSIGDVRGHGLFLGIDLVRNRVTREPAPEIAEGLVRSMAGCGILMSTDGPHGNVIKIKPPLVLDASDIDMTLRCIDRSLTRLQDS